MQPIAAGQHAGLHAQREPEVRLLPAGFADEAGWREPRKRKRERHVAQGSDTKGTLDIFAELDRKFVVVDGKKYPAVDGSAAGMPVFSPDSQHFAYVALRGGKQCVVRDGEPGADFEMVSSAPPLFSPDSKRLAYLAKDGGRGLVVLDGKAGEPFRNIAAMSFSPDSQHFAYIAISVTNMLVMLDGREVYRDERFVKDSLGFDGSNSLHVLTLRDGQIIRARIDLLPDLEALKK